MFSINKPQPLPRGLLGVLWLFAFSVVLRNAWLCEDAYITYRAADNWVHGFGPRWNTLERVQVYTHPLWFLGVSLIHAITRDIYFSAMSLSLVCSGVTLLLLLRTTRSTWQAIVLVAIVTMSKGFIDYSTGGLENPLSHLLLALFFREYLRRDKPARFARMVLWMALCLVNRMDLVWLMLPAVVHETWRNGYWRPRRLWVWSPLLLFVAWEVFAFLYYGFFFPNSAYAKMTTQVRASALAVQGVGYLVNSISWDPIVLSAMAALLFVGLRRWRLERKLVVLVVGVLLEMAYVVRVGGDYMSGRFLTAPLLVSLFILSRVEFESFTSFATTLALVLLLGLTSPRPPLLTTDKYEGLGSAPQQVDDERGFRFGDTGLLHWNRTHNLQNQGGWVADGIMARREGVRVRVYKNVGFYGFFAGPAVHIIDPYGIGDPLMARMPFNETMGPWSSGHFYRNVPAGYEAAAIDAGFIEDPALQAYWEKLRFVTRGPIFNRDRLVLALRFNLGLEPIPH